MEHPLQILQNDSEALDLNAVGDKCSFVIVQPCRIKAVGLVPLSGDTGGATVKFDRQPTAGSSSGRGDGDCGVITVPASDQQGNVLYQSMTSSDLQLDAGDQIVVEVTAEAAAANSFFKPFVEIYRVIETRANQSDASAA